MIAFFYIYCSQNTPMIKLGSLLALEWSNKSANVTENYKAFISYLCTRIPH